MKSAKIFTPIQIGNRTFRNRIMMAPMTLSIESMDGTVSEELQKHYVERAEGGVGIVTDKNYDKYASAETKAAVEAAQKGIMDGSIKVDTAFDANFDLAALRDSVRP